MLSYKIQKVDALKFVKANNRLRNQLIAVHTLIHSLNSDAPISLKTLEGKIASLKRMERAIAKTLNCSK